MRPPGDVRLRRNARRRDTGPVTQAFRWAVRFWSWNGKRVHCDARVAGRYVLRRGVPPQGHDPECSRPAFLRTAAAGAAFEPGLRDRLLDFPSGLLLHARNVRKRERLQFPRRNPLLVTVGFRIGHASVVSWEGLCTLGEHATRQSAFAPPPRGIRSPVEEPADSGFVGVNSQLERGGAFASAALLLGFIGFLRHSLDPFGARLSRT